MKISLKCQTWVKGKWTSNMIVAEIAKAFYECSKVKNIPGASEIECGNYRLNDLEGAKKVCKEYFSLLQNIPGNRLVYPK